MFFTDEELDGDDGEEMEGEEEEHEERSFGDGGHLGRYVCCWIQL